ncbi:MAG: TatD family hydrolase [Leptospiraceae bacterium]|nr:TatD family hydrolase [Leptospiraceae bacterium]
MSISVIDTHCHLDILESYGLPMETSISNSINSGVKKILQVGVDLESSKRAIQIAKDNNDPLDIYFSIGYHPTHKFTEEEKQNVKDLIVKEKNNPKFVAVGEIGLDYFHKDTEPNEQEKAFREFIELSIDVKAPIIIHSRDAAEDTYNILKEYKDKAFGVIHCFTYDREYAFKFFELGYYISFSGIVTFNSAKDIQQAAKELPLEAILVETDAPFLAPTPYRGKRNEPSYVPHVLEKLFSLRSEDKDIIEKTIFKNSESFLSKRQVLC